MVKKEVIYLLIVHFQRECFYIALPVRLSAQHREGRQVKRVFSTEKRRYSGRWRIQGQRRETEPGERPKRGFPHGRAEEPTKGKRTEGQQKRNRKESDERAGESAEADQSSSSPAVTRPTIKETIKDL